jgi:hypothetical protein
MPRPMCDWDKPFKMSIDKYIINYKPDILNGLSQSHVGLGILTLLNIS